MWGVAGTVTHLLSPRPTAMPYQYPLFAFSLPLRRSSSSRVRRSTCPKRCRSPSLSFGQPPVPPSIQELDELERRRRQNAQDNPPAGLSPETEAALFAKIPELAKLSQRMEKEMNRGDFNPDDPAPVSWAYNRLRPWAPSRLLVAVTMAAVAYLARKIVRLLQATYTAPTFIAAVLRLEYMLHPTLLLFPALCTAYAVRIARDDIRNDGVRRCLVMHTLSSMLLLPVAGVASVGHGTLASSLGAALRILSQTGSLWYWRDLQHEVWVGNSFFARIFRVWRFAVTIVMIILGGGMRLVGVMAEQRFPVGEALASGAGKARVALGTRFPVAMSLCNDPRGIFFVSCLGLAAGFVYMLYVIAFVVDFGRVRSHRDSQSMLTLLMTRTGVYHPNESPWDTVGALGDSGASFLPSRPMLLKPNSGVMIESSLLSNEANVAPIFSLLDKEEEVMQKEGVDSWLKPRYEQVPLSEELSEKKRCMDALVTWARPLDDKEADLTFEEFFETLEEDEFEYDPARGDWIFGNELKDQNGSINDDVVQGVMNANDASLPEMEQLEALIRQLGDVDMKDIINDPGLDPTLREILQQRNKEEDDSDESVTVFV